MLFIIMIICFFMFFIAVGLCLVSLFFDRELSLISFCGGVIFMLIFFGSSFLYVSISHEDTYQSNEQEIVSLQDGTKIKGEGSGCFLYSHINIDEQDVYTYYRKDNNGYVKENITLENDMDSLIIYEDNNVTPSVKEYTKEFTTEWGNTWDYLILGTKMTTKHYEVYVPIGSVVQEYKLDAQ